MKAILVDPQIKREILPSTVDRFLTFGYVPGEETLFKGIYKLPPGSFMVVKMENRDQAVLGPLFLVEFCDAERR